MQQNPSNPIVFLRNSLSIEDLCASNACLVISFSIITSAIFSLSDGSPSICFLPQLGQNFELTGICAPHSIQYIVLKI
jgi:hypothetical protein